MECFQLFIRELRNAEYRVDYCMRGGEWLNCFDQFHWSVVRAHLVLKNRYLCGGYPVPDLRGAKNVVYPTTLSPTVRCVLGSSEGGI